MKQIVIISNMGSWLISDVSPWVVSVCGLVLVITGLFQVGAIYKYCRSVSVWIWVFLGVFVVIGGLFRFYSPDQHRIYFDEDRYLSGAVTFAKFGTQRLINVATNDTFLMGDADLVARVTVPTLNAWIFKVFGYSEKNLFIASRFFSTSQIVFVFVAVALYLRSLRMGLVAAGIFAVLPVPVFWSLSIGLDSYFVFFALLAFIGAVWYGSRPVFLSWLFLLSSTLLLLFVRLEAFLFLGVQLMAIFAIRKQLGLSLLTKKDAGYVLVSVCLIGFRAVVSLSVLGQTWCCGDATPLEAFSTGYIVRNTLPNILSLFKRPEWPAVLSIFSLLGVLAIKDVRKWAFVSWFGFYFLIYSFYFAGEFFSVEYSGSYGRYFLMLVAPLTILAVWYCSLLVRSYFIHRQRKSFFVLLGVVVALSLLPTVFRYKRMISVSPYYEYVDKGPRDVHTYIEDYVTPRISSDAVVIHAMTALSLLHGNTVVYYGSFLYNTSAQEFVQEQLAKGKDVYMLQTYTCDRYPDKCTEVTSKFVFEAAPQLDAMGMSMLKVRLKK